jgi:hypothetical protein
MTIDSNKEFIQNKLGQIESAVMYPMSSDVGKLPNDVIHFLKVDDYGQIWFAGHKPRGWVRTYDQRFPVRLLFYRKGIEFYIETSGVATIANAEEILQHRDLINDGAVLYKMTPTLLEYTQTRKPQPAAGTNKFSNIFYNWFMRLLAINPIHQYRLIEPKKTKN